MFDASTIPMLQEVIGFTQARHEILAGNIANIDTPGYRTRDLNEEVFHDKLKKALVTKDQSKHGVLSPGLSQVKQGDAMREVRDSMKSILYHDDSNVSLEHQVTQISKNQSMHNLAISIMNSQFRLLEAAISERV
jgi:flagellar basal-body rod protein FlgB